MIGPALLYESKPSGDGRINVAMWVCYPGWKRDDLETSPEFTTMLALWHQLGLNA